MKELIAELIQKQKAYGYGTTAYTKLAADIQVLSAALDVIRQYQRIEVGDIVRPRKGREGYLVSGRSHYDQAVCVSIEPFYLVSEEGDMMWYYQEAEHYKSCGPATPEVQAVVMARYEKSGGR